MLQMPRVEHTGPAESRAAGVIQRMRQRQVAVQNGGDFSAEEFISSRRSALGEHERKVQKASWLGVEDTLEICRVDLHPSFVGDMQEEFRAMLDGLAVFENVPSTILQPKSACCVTGNLAGESSKLWDCVVLVRLPEARRNGSCSWWLGASKGRSGAPSLNHTCREICVTIPVCVCRWIAPEANPADEPSRS